MALKLKSLSTRNKAKQLARKAEQDGSQKIDLAGIEFISRSCADELVNQADERGLEIVGVEDDVAQMLEIVSG